MPAYWRGEMTPHENKAQHFIEQEVSGYENMKELLAKLEAGNVNSDQIVVMFTASETKGASNPERNTISKVQKTWNTDCDIFEDVVDLFKSKVVNPPPVGWLVKVRITMEEWNDDKSPFKLDEDFALSELPTMIVYNTMKRIAGRKAFNMDNIIIMLED